MIIYIITNAFGSSQPPMAASIIWTPNKIHGVEIVFTLSNRISNQKKKKSQITIIIPGLESIIRGDHAGNVSSGPLIDITSATNRLICGRRNRLSMVIMPTQRHFNDQFVSCWITQLLTTFTWGLCWHVLTTQPLTKRDTGRARHVVSCLFVNSLVPSFALLTCMAKSH